MIKCSNGDCPTEAKHLGLCKKCYNRAYYERIRGERKPRRRYPPDHQCEADPTCPLAHKARGLCHLHYSRWWEDNRRPAASPRSAERPRCAAPNCDSDRPLKGLGLCDRCIQTYYRRQRGVEERHPQGSFGRQWQDPVQRELLRQRQSEGAKMKWARIRAAKAKSDR